MGNCIHIPGAFISYGGPFVKMRVGKMIEYFEMHSYCGPIRLTKKWEERKVDWGSRNAFWGPFEVWLKSGQEVDEDGFAIVEQTNR